LSTGGGQILPPLPLFDLFYPARDRVKHLILGITEGIHYYYIDEEFFS